MEAAHEIEKLAASKGIEIVEPFTGVKTADGVLRVLGPSEEYYREVLSQFDHMPALAEAKRGIMALFNAAVEAVKWIAEQWDQELLVEPSEDATSAENNSSTILLLTTTKGKQYMLTGDAGVPALSRALAYAASIGISLTNMAFFQAPHHGSKRNIGPSVLNQLFGDIKPLGTAPDKSSFISCAVDGAPKHPNKRITNALLRRGVKPFITAGQGKWHHDDAPSRNGWITATPLPFYHQVEDDD